VVGIELTGPLMTSQVHTGVYNKVSVEREKKMSDTGAVIVGCSVYSSFVNNGRALMLLGISKFGPQTVDLSAG